MVRGGRETVLEVTVRFLHLIARTIGAFVPPLAEWPVAPLPAFRAVETLQVGTDLYQCWQEAEERTIDLGEIELGSIRMQTHACPFNLGGARAAQPIHRPDGQVAGVVVREQQSLEGLVQLTAAPLADQLFKLTLRVHNRTPLAHAHALTRQDASLWSMASVHSLLGIRRGEFISMLDPPQSCRDAVASCTNVGTWPVLVGAEGQTDTMLSSPIILYDYPKVAPESPGDLFDATEIDEILTLRVLALTDAEKEAMTALDPRARDLLARTERLAREQLYALHATFREIRPLPGEGTDG